MESLNRAAIELVDEAIDFADELGIGVRHLDNDAVVLDFGVDRRGGIEAGLLLAEIQTGGLATVQTRLDAVAGAAVPHVELSTDHPSLALLGSQQAGWAVEVDGFRGVGSGPARLLIGGGDAVDRHDHAEAFDLTVLAVEAAALPGEAVAEHVAAHAGVPTGGVFLPTAPAASLCGSVTMAARAAEVAIGRLAHLGYDVRDVAAATASAPVAPVAADEAAALGRTNDALAYGARVHLVVETEPDTVDALPFATTDVDSFHDAFADGVRDLEALESAFAPAQVTVDVRGGPTRVVGAVDEDRLADAFGL